MITLVMELVGFCLITHGQSHLIEKLKLILSKSSLKSLMLLLVSYIKTLNPITAENLLKPSL